MYSLYRTNCNWYLIALKCDITLRSSKVHFLSVNACHVSTHIYIYNVKKSMLTSLYLSSVTLQHQQ